MLCIYYLVFILSSHFDPVSFLTAGIPDSPEPPVVREFKDAEFEVTWTLPEDNGEKITHFVLQYKYVQFTFYSLYNCSH